jgi:hypothetical protein
MMLPHSSSVSHWSTLPIDEQRILNIREAERALSPSWRARLAARLFGAGLDRALIDGADPAASQPLCARAGRLTSPPIRRDLAEGLELIASRAQTPSRRWWAVPRVSAADANAEQLRELAALLRDRPAPQARGVAIVLRLLSDGTGPMYNGNAAALERELREARAAIAR